jgi:hypothetical protein
MDVPMHIIDLMFSTPSDEMLLVSEDHFPELWKTPPAIDEWLRAKCPDPLTNTERVDLEHKHSFSKGYQNYLTNAQDAHIECIGSAKESVRSQVIRQFSQYSEVK